LLANRDPGFRSDHLLTFDIGLSGPQYDDDAAQFAFNDHLTGRLSAIPGVRAVAIATPLPLQGQQMSVAFDIEQHPAAVPDRPHAAISIVTPGYFAAMGIPVLRGRDFSERDDMSAPRVQIVNEAFARKYFPGENAIGKRIMPGASHGKDGMVMREIVGIVGNAKQVVLTADPDPIYYFPLKQLNWGMGTIVLRTAVPPLQVESAAHAALAELDRDAPMYRIRTGEDLAASAVELPKFLTTLMGMFAGVALLLTVAGLYSVLSYTVARRHREIGLRIALGARREEVLGMVVKEAMQLVIAGLVLGLIAALGAGKLIESVVFGIKPGNPLVLAGACCLMVIVGIAAAWLPATKAAATDPMNALRTE
jgi:predicted permease